MPDIIVIGATPAAPGAPAMSSKRARTGSAA